MKKALFLILFLLVSPAFALDVTWDGVQYTCSPTGPPPPNSCIFTYSACGPCQPNNTCVRTETGRSPAGCVGTPILTQSCIYQPPTGCSPPAGAEVLVLETRYTRGFPVGETVFSVPITTQINRIKGQIGGISPDADVVWTWILPDCTSFHGTVLGDGGDTMMDLRSRHSIVPNINYDYIPVGNHTFKVKANNFSSILIWFQAY